MKLFSTTTGMLMLAIGITASMVVSLLEAAGVPGEDSTIYGFRVKDADGEEVLLGDRYRGKVVLIVNVASQCGLTKANYKELKDLVEQYGGEGFAVAAFPCNQFGGQEPDACPLIRENIQDTYHFQPDLYEKIDVNGAKEHEVYKFLKSQKGGGLFGSSIKWNFTKFLVDRRGRVIERYAPTTSPKSFEKDIKKLLTQKVE